MAKLRESEIMCAAVLQEKGRSVRSVAKDLGVDESTVRYRLERLRSGAVDGRRGQPEACDPHGGTIQVWIDEQRDRRRPESVRALYERLVTQEGYRGSYRSVLRYVARRRPTPRVRPVRRVETAPGMQAQVDWVNGPRVFIAELGGASVLPGFVMTLSHSRMWALIWSRREDLLSWLTCHNAALVRLGGVPTTVRIDNLKTGVASGAGPRAVVQEGYASYARQVGFVINPCRVRRPSDKGKVERRGRDVKGMPIRAGESFASVAAMQEATDQRIRERARQWLCPVSGQSIHATWQAERSALQALPPTLPAPFDVQVDRPVGRDCLVSFEGRQYSVPFRQAGRTVAVRGCADTVEIYAGGERIACYPRGTACRLLVDQDTYEGPGDERVLEPTPLGRLGRQIVLRRSWEAGEVAGRGMACYAAVVEALS